MCGKSVNKKATFDRHIGPMRHSMPEPAVPPVQFAPVLVRLLQRRCVREHEQYNHALKGSGQAAIVDQSKQGRES